MLHRKVFAHSTFIDKVETTFWARDTNLLRLNLNNPGVVGHGSLHHIVDTLHLCKNTRVTHNVVFWESFELMLEPLPKMEIQRRSRSA